MGKWSRGILRQKFQIQIDMSKLQEYITDEIVKSIESIKDNKGKKIFDVDIDESYFDEADELHIDGSYDTGFKHWYCSATLYEPEEDELEREYIGEDGVGLLDDFPKELREMIDIKKVIEDEEDISFPYDEDY